MPREIERKFLLESDAWRALVVRKEDMRQGYLARGARASVRVRIAADEATLNIKSGGLVASRQEYEYGIPLTEAQELIALCSGPLIEKTRHFIPNGDLKWEIDEFHGDNAGLVVAEIELAHETQAFALPPWIGTEVTHLTRYYNVRLIERPYSTWSEAERTP